MFGLFDKKKRSLLREKELTRDIKVFESQRNLLDAATATADAANLVTNRLKARLEDSVAQFENTARIMNDALIICDDKGAIQAFNPAAELLFGVTSLEVRETFVGDLFGHDLDDASEVWSMLDDGCDLTGVRRGEGHFAMGINHTRLDRSDGTSIVLLVLCDLNPSLEAKSYRSAFEASFDGILVVKDNTIVAANPAISKLFGYETDDLLAKSFDTLIFSMQNARLELPQESDGINLVVDAYRRDGAQMEVYFTTTTIWWNAEPASLITIRDMTAIRASEKIVDNPKMICTFNGAYEITFSNHLFAKHYGCSPKTLVGMDIRSLMSANERSLFQMHINNLSITEPTRRMQMQVMLPGAGTTLQVWTDHMTVDEDGIEYQRIGRDLSGATSTDFV